MKDQRKSALLLAGMVAVAIVAAPVVVAPAADARAFCDEAGGTKICQRSSCSVPIKATPGTVAAPHMPGIKLHGNHAVVRFWVGSDSNGSPSN